MSFRTVEQLQAENERLRALVETAYAEAWFNCDEGVRTFAFSWKYSDSRAALQPKGEPITEDRLAERDARIALQPKEGEG